MNRTYQSIETLFELFLIKASLRFEGCLNFFCTLFFIILLFFCSIVKIICNLSRKSFIILQLGQINNLHDSVLFYKNLCSTAGKFVHSVVWQHFTLYHIFTTEQNPQHEYCPKVKISPTNFNQMKSHANIYVTI